MWTCPACKGRSGGKRKAAAHPKKRGSDRDQAIRDQRIEEYKKMAELKLPIGGR